MSAASISASEATSIMAGTYYCPIVYEITGHQYLQPSSTKEGGSTGASGKSSASAALTKVRQVLFRNFSLISK
jgi:hypothetical protein